MLNITLLAIIEGQDAISEYHFILGLNHLGTGLDILALGLLKLGRIGLAIVEFLGHGIERGMGSLGGNGACTELALGGNGLIISLPDILIECRLPLFQFKFRIDTLHLGTPDLIAR